MNTPSPSLIEHHDLSHAWFEIFEKIVESPGHEITPLVLTLTGFEESVSIKKILNEHLRKNKFHSVETVSETIFPESLFRFCGNEKDLLYSTYLGNLKRIKKIDPANRRGTYFERLIAYDEQKQVNQLEIIISALKAPKSRRSKLQASIFDPTIYHLNDAYQKFPCLQHVTFYKSESGGLIINSFYAIQFLYQKAYGNWLGLINLGKFVASQSGIELERFNCFIGVEQLESKISKTEAKKLLNQIRSEIPNNDNAKS